MERYFGNRVRMFRERADMTQLELAEKLGYRSESMISKIENGENPVPAKKIAKFANALGVSIETLIGQEEIDNTPDLSIEIEETASMKHILMMVSKMTPKQISKAEKIIEMMMEE